MQMRAMILVMLCFFMPAVAFGQTASENASAEQNPMFVVSVNNANLSPEATVMGFDVRISSGSVLVAPLLPKGWETVIRNFIVQTPPWHSTMNATAEEGAEGVDMGAFQRFLIVEQDPDLEAENAFAVEVGLITTTDGQSFGITWLPKDAISLTPFTLPAE
ncbi:hypothetical protein [Megalodesulfovibrio paquesii]